ncbi:MAG: GTPase Era [Rhodospirillales bacterium]|nr:GTPase Era [Rhodospirillales bacterium]
MAEASPAAAPPTPAEGARAGFIAIIGAPNVGKSTLLNRVVGAKVSIVSPKVQTTRTRVRGILITGKTQVVFVDTPGIFKPQRRLDRAMVAAAWAGASEADEIVLLVDAVRGVDRDTRAIVERLKQSRRKVVLAINKVDAVNKPALLALADPLYREGIFTETFMISATTGDGVDDMVAALAGRMPEGPWLFPSDELSDMPERLMAAEITREQLYLQLRKELPYKATVETERWEDRADGSVKIDQVIYVERDSQKAIVLGKGGRQVKAIGAAARKELQAILDCQVHLFLFVKVRENWGNDPERFRDWGLDFKA